LKRTLAPFAQPEKPQVFPTPATNFIMNGPDIIMLEAISGTAGANGAVSENRRRYGYACFD
jgi:hypothetical protein